MKLFALLSLIGFVAASTNQLRWGSGQEYEFEYEGRQLTGIPELATHYSGLGIRATIHLQVQENQQFAVRISNARYARVNQQLNGQGTSNQDNWRQLQLPQYVPIPSDSARALESPTHFNLKSNGEFESLQVSKENEAEWSVNFKKALVALFQTKFEQGLTGLDDNRVQTNSNEDSMNYWKTQEQSLDGICDVVYQVNELPEYVMKDQPQMFPHAHSCQNGKAYEITRSRDVNSCSKRTSFNFYKPGFFRCPSGNCDGMWSRSSNTRYIACGSDRSNLRLQTIVNEGELEQNLLGFKAEKFLTGVQQVLRLKAQRPIGSAIPMPSDPISFQSLFYEYKLQKNGGGDYEDLSANSRQSQSGIKTLIRHYRQNTKGSSGDRTERLKQELQRLFKQIVNEDFQNVEDLSKKELPMKTLSLARAFSLLEKEAIAEVYQSLKSEFGSNQEKQQQFRNVFFDTLVMGGTPDNIQFLVQQIKARELSAPQIASIYTYLSHTIVLPTPNLLENLFDLVRQVHGAFPENPYVYNTAVMGYSALIQKACIAENRKTSYPTFVFGEFCNRDSAIVTEKWIPYLQQELNKDNSGNTRHQDLALAALGLLGHKNVISVVLPHIEQNNNNGNNNNNNGNNNRQTRLLAVYALAAAGRQNPELAIPAIMAVLSNQAENTEIRIAAFNVLLKLNPNMASLQRIVSLTWTERDQEVLQAINTAFFTLSHQKEQGEQSAMETTGSNLNRKAYLIYPLLKKTGGQIPTSATLFSSDYLNLLGVGYQDTFSYTANKDSRAPSQYYVRLVQLMSRFQVTTFELGGGFRGAENLVQQFAELLTSGSTETRSEFAEKVKEQLNSEWKQVIQQLNIKTRDQDQDSQGSIYMNFFEDAPIFQSFQSQSASALKQQLAGLMNPSELKDKVCGQHNLNIQKSIDVIPNEYSIPSDMGFPIVTEVHMPVVLSLRGQVNIDCGANRGLIPSVQVNARAMYASQLTGWVGTVVPFTNEFVVTGVDEQAIVNLPFEISANYNADQQKINIKMNPVQGINRPIEALHFHVRPYTVRQDLWDLRPMTLNQNTKVIRSPTAPKTITKDFGEYFGLRLKSVMTTESRFTDFRSIMERLRLYNYNPVNLLRFGWVSTAISERQRPSLRFHQYQVQYDPSSSSTKQVEFQIKFGYANKVTGQPIQYKFLELKNESGRLGYPAWKSLLPLKVISKNIGEKSEQPERQREIKRTMEQSGIESGEGAQFDWAVIFHSSSRQQRVVSYKLNLARGEEGLKSKWHVQLSNNNNNNNGDSEYRNICVDGHVEKPQLPYWNIEQLRNTNLEYHYVNNIGFGNNNCQEHQIKINGVSKTTEEQKRYSRESPEAKQLKKMSEDGVPMVQLSKIAKKVRRQASTLDQVQFTIQYQNVPQRFMRYSEQFVEYVKALYWPYLQNKNESSVSGGSRGEVSQTNNWLINFNPTGLSFDLNIRRENRPQIQFENIRLPWPLEYFVPYSAVGPNSSPSLGGHIGRSYQTCSLDGQWLRTYDNRTVHAVVEDKCYRLFTADCSSQKSFSVLVSDIGNHGPHSEKEIKVYVGPTVMHLQRRGDSGHGSQNVKVTVNATEVNYQTGHRTPILDNNKNLIAEISQSKDGVLTLETIYSTMTGGRPLVSVHFDGKLVEVETSSLYKNKMCGLCGDHNGQKNADLRGPEQCVFSSPEVFTASYKVKVANQQSCGSLPTHVEQKLRQEKQSCAKYQELPTKVVKSFESQTGPCTRHAHQMIERPSELCFSRKPITACSPKCKPQSSSSIVQKNVSMTCLQKGRTADHYADKVRSGKVIPSLENLHESFVIELPLPKVCIPVNPRLN